MARYFRGLAWRLLVSKMGQHQSFGVPEDGAHAEFAINQLLWVVSIYRPSRLGQKVQSYLNKIIDTVDLIIARFFSPIKTLLIAVLSE